MHKSALPREQDVLWSNYVIPCQTCDCPQKKQALNNRVQDHHHTSNHMSSPHYLAGVRRHWGELQLNGSDRHAQLNNKEYSSDRSPCTLVMRFTIHVLRGARRAVGHRHRTGFQRYRYVSGLPTNRVWQWFVSFTAVGSEDIPK